MTSLVAFERWSHSNRFVVVTKFYVKLCVLPFVDALHIRVKEQRKKDDAKDAPVAKHTASKTRNMYPPVYASVVETTVLPPMTFSFFFRRVFVRLWESFFYVMSFSSFELEKLDRKHHSLFEDKKGFEFEKTRTPFTIIIISSVERRDQKGGRKKEHPSTVKKRNAEGVVPFFRRISIHKHREREREKKRGSSLFNR